MTLEQLGSGGAEHHQGHAGHAVRQGVDEVEERVVRPVQVFEDKNDGL